MQANQETNTLWARIVEELRCAWHRQPYGLRTLARSRGVDPADLVQAIAVRQLPRAHGIAFVEGDARKRYAFTLMRSALLDEVRRAERRPCLEVPETLRDVGPNPEEALRIKRRAKQEAYFIKRLRADPLTAAALEGTTCEYLVGVYESERGPGLVSPSTAFRALKKRLKRLAYELRQLPLFPEADAQSRLDLRE